MKSVLKRTAGVLLGACMVVSMLSFGNGAVTADAAQNGGLQNGALTAGTDGWTVGGNIEEVSGSYGCSDGYLSIWTPEAASFSISQTVSGLAAGNYTASVAAVGNGNQGAPESEDSLVLTVKTENAEQSVQITTDGWDNWDNIISTDALEVAEGDSVTVIISGDLVANDWYGIKNVTLETETSVEAPITVQKVSGLSEDFIHGVDVSTYLSEVQSGVKYYDENGDEQNLFKILADAGVNYARLRVWNCPYKVDENGDYLYADAEGTTTYTADQVAKVTENDVYGYKEYFLEDGTQVYRQGYGAGNCDVETAIAIGRAATQYNIRVLIDFHYSDFWADPKKQSVPKAWTGLSMEEKTEALAEFTRESLQALKAAGVDVGMVQIGNEINNGMAGETDSANVYTLLKAGSAAVRSVDSNILVAVHFTDPQSEGYQLGRASELANAGVDYDVFATSYYPFWHGTTSQLTADLKEIADTYGKKVMVAEVSYAWTNEDGDGYPNVVYAGAGDQTFPYPMDVEGQATAVRDTIAAVAAVGDAGIGTFYWEPAWIPINNIQSAENAEVALNQNMAAWRQYGSGWGSVYAQECDPEIVDDNNGSTWDNQAFFDFDGNVLPSLNVYKWVYTGAKGPTRVSNVDSAVYEMDYGTEPALPETVNVNLNDGTTVTAPVVWNAEQTEALKTADFGDYVVDGSVGAFSYVTGDETVQVDAGTWTTTCSVTVTGYNCVVNGSFEDNDGDGSGWTLINYLGENVGWPGTGKSSSNAKSGLYYYTAWNQGELDFAIEQTIEEAAPAGLYTLFAYYQGTGVDELRDDSALYAVVTYKDGTEKTVKADVEIHNIWKDFYQAKVSGIELDENVASIKVGTRISCTAQEIGAWVVVDDISLMKYAELPSVDEPTPDDPKPPVTDDPNPPATDDPNPPATDDPNSPATNDPSASVQNPSADQPSTNIQKPDTNSGKTPAGQTSTAKKPVKTGDVNAIPWIIAVLCAAAVCAGVVFGRKRRVR